MAGLLFEVLFSWPVFVVCFWINVSSLNLLLTITDVSGNLVTCNLEASSGSQSPCVRKLTTRHVLKMAAIATNLGYRPLLRQLSPHRKLRHICHDIF